MEKISLREMLEDVGADVRSYSGRGMFGKQCIGITGDISEMKDTLKCVLDRLFDLVADDDSVDIDDIKETAHKLLDRQQDSMGLDYVWYWPDEPWTD